MGYSEIGLALTALGVKTLNERLAQASPEIREKVEDLLDCADDIDEGEKSALYHWDSLSWNMDDQVPEFFDGLFGTLDCGDFLFIRIEGATVDTWGTYYHNPYGMDIEHKVKILRTSA